MYNSTDRDFRVKLRPLDWRSRIALLVASVNVVLFALMSLVHWAAWGGMEKAESDLEGDFSVLTQALVVFAIDLLYGAVVLVTSLAFRLHTRTWAVRLAIITVAAVLWSVPRIGSLENVDSTPTGGAYDIAEWVAGTAAVAVAVAAALLTVDLVGKARAADEKRREERARAARAIDELQREELRVRRTIADRLHGDLQFRLVTVVAGLDSVADELEQFALQRTAATVRQMTETLEEIREADVRSLSYSIFPAGVDVGTEEAIRVLLDRLPPTVRASVAMGEQLRALTADRSTAPPIGHRLVSVYTIEEAVSNALRHGHATAVRITVDAIPGATPADWILDVTVDDDGTGLGDHPPALQGLERHRARIRTRGGELSLVPGPGGGCRVHFTLPWRLSEGTIDQAQMEF